VQLAELEWRSDEVRWNNSGSTAVTINPFVYHTYRIAYVPGPNGENGTYAAWIDGALIANTLGGITTTANHLLLGDTSNARHGGTTTWDYVRWDTTGAYAPIPEPASLAALALGGVLLGRRR